MRTSSSSVERRQPLVRQTSDEFINLEKPDNLQLLRMAVIVYGAIAESTHGVTRMDAIVIPEITRITLRSSYVFESCSKTCNFLEMIKKTHTAHIVISTRSLYNGSFPKYQITRSQTYAFPVFSRRGSPDMARIKNPLRRLKNGACPHHGFSELHQLDTLYNALNTNDQDSLNFAASNFLDKMPRECLKIIESKSKVRNLRSKPVVAKVSTSTSTSKISPDVSELKDMVKALLLDKKNQSQAPAHQTPAPVKAVEESYVTCGGAYSYQSCPATDGNVYHDNIQAYVSQAAAANFNQGNTGARPPMSRNPNPEPNVAPVVTPVPKASIPFPSMKK
ncbi:hypothetical protein Tco_1211136 [Tanacetum coccineum]